jgi:hypothetical protein
MDDGSKPSVTISEDGKELVYRSADGDIIWRRGVPTQAEWQRFLQLGPSPTIVARGRFNFAGANGKLVSAR